MRAGVVFVAGDLESDAELIERIITVMEGARVGACRSRPAQDPPIRFGTIDLSGRRQADPDADEAPE